MQKTSVKKLALASMMVAVAVVGSTFSFPVLGSRCAPVQHMVNVARYCWAPGTDWGLLLWQAFCAIFWGLDRCLPFRAACAGLSSAGWVTASPGIFR